jgi:signal transduction histidine kinase
VIRALTQYLNHGVIDRVDAAHRAYVAIGKIVQKQAFILLIRTAKTRSGGVLVAVRDCGPNLDPANLERIFDAFFSTKADGLGMGLSIRRAIIQAHGGRLSATRGVPQGTVLQFTLPAGTDGAS